ncbi:hypothetical protein TW78_01515 [Vibrio coralliilyticus]|uniref:Uncharacterized protein n=1 Tax=Vibrio coralliilyticus TaxID=190893 RepID=A0A837G2I7_9VIBR|nr:hypothetical protein [Vibrio coralliilyticus]KJY79406.1 hypothetical protein TW78_01515 [Vibrio coralliilyticus]QOU30677.1 hypothetical protein TW71_003920 [Vibrio coralliilyticus]
MYEQVKKLKESKNKYNLKSIIQFRNVKNKVSRSFSNRKIAVQFEGQQNEIFRPAIIDNRDSITVGKVSNKPGNAINLFGNHPTQRMKHDKTQIRTLDELNESIAQNKPELGELAVLDFGEGATLQKINHAISQLNKSPTAYDEKVSLVNALKALFPQAVQIQAPAGYTKSTNGDSVIWIKNNASPLTQGAEKKLHEPDIHRSKRIIVGGENKTNEYEKYPYLHDYKTNQLWLLDNSSLNETHNDGNKKYIILRNGKVDKNGYHVF